MFLHRSVSKMFNTCLFLFSLVAWVHVCSAAPLILQRARVPVHNVAKLTLADWGSYNRRDHNGPGTYAYGYDIEDPTTGNVQFKQEERHRNGTVTGSYGYLDSNGQARVLHYVSDHNGYRVVENSEDATLSDPIGSPLDDVTNDVTSSPPIGQDAPALPTSPLLPPNVFGNDHVSAVPATSPNFDQKLVNNIRNPVLYSQPWQPLTLVKTGLPVLVYSDTFNNSGRRWLQFKV